MNVPIPSASMKTPDVAIRPLLAEDTTAILRAILQASDYGVLLTDLDHGAMACNRRFGEIFEVDIETVVHSGVEELRNRVRHLIANLDVWRRNLDEVYADPYCIQEDELRLLKRPEMTLRRFTGPVLSADGSVIGRLWTFLDITREVRRRQMQSVLNQVSLFYATDPAEVYNSIVEAISRFYGGAAAVLGVRRGDFLVFKAAHGLTGTQAPRPGLELEETYSRFVLETDQPVLIQDARQHPEYAGTRAVREGFTRYLGVPFYDNQRRPLGVLCFTDGRSDEVIDEQDIQFLSLLAMRVSAEIARETYLKTRLREQRAVMNRQRANLAITHEVLTAMNSAFGLLEPEAALESLLDGQLALLQGLLGYDSAAILLRDEKNYDLQGRLLSASDASARALTLPLAQSPELAARLDPVGDRIAFTAHPPEALREALGSAVCCLARLDCPGPQGLLVLGRRALPGPQDQHHFTHLEALVEQVALLLSTHLLQRELIAAHDALRATQEKLIQSEKVSVVGALAVATAHDIRNILSALEIELTFGNTEPESALEAVRGNLDRFMVLTHRLLSYARPRRVVRQRVEVHELLQRVLALTATQLRISSIRLHYQEEPNLPDIIGDPHQLEHLFVNLILNAVQAMEPKGGTLTTIIRQVESRVEISLTDTGRGMTPETLARLFEPFQSTRHEGFGLGLFSCKRIIEDQQGEITVTSQPGVGTTFRIILPTKESE